MLVIKTLRTLVAKEQMTLAPQAGEQFFDSCLMQISESPDLVIHVMTSEISILSDTDVSKWTALAIRHFPLAQHCVISLACLGLYAALLHAESIRANSVLLLFSDAPLVHTQAMLDSIGLGAGKNSDKMQSQESLAFVHFHRKACKDITSDDIVVQNCRVIAKSPGNSGNLQLVAELITLFQSSFCDVSDLVSFEVGSKWSQKIWSLFKLDVCRSIHGLRFHPSSEQNHIHRLSVKPLLEIIKYRNVLRQNHVLAVTSIGAGGRIGLLKLTNGSEHFREFLQQEYKPFLNSIKRTPVTFQNGIFHLPPEEKFLFIAKDYLGIDDMYFIWPIHIKNSQ